MLDVFGLERGVEELDSLKSRAFSIISRRMSMFSLCLACMEAIAAATVEVTALEIECCIVEFIAGGAVIASKQKTAARNLFASVSQKGS